MKKLGKISTLQNYCTQLMTKLPIYQSMFLLMMAIWS